MSSAETSGLVFLRERDERPAVELWVNFGIFAGRTVTRAEIDRLAEWLLDLVDPITIVSEERHEIGSKAEATVHQIRIDLAPGQAPADPSARQKLTERLIERADHWARACIADRPGVGEGN